MTEVRTGELCKGETNAAAPPCDHASVAVIIPAFNCARFIAEAITSVLLQTRQADEIIVVDDGSTDDLASVVARFPKTKLLRQNNRGPSAARNVGLQNCSTRYVIFLDADDRLLPTAIEAGLACIIAEPDCAFVYGGHRKISEDGRPISPDCVFPIEGNSFLELVRRNRITTTGTVLFKRNHLLEVGGFDETLWRVEDYDLYLRLAERYPITHHQTIVTEYRKHNESLSNNHVAQLQTAYRVLHRLESRVTTDALTSAAFRQGRATVTAFYVSAMFRTAVARWNESHDIVNLTKDVIQAAQYSPSALIRSVGRHFVKNMLRAVRR